MKQFTTIFLGSFLSTCVFGSVVPAKRTAPSVSDIKNAVYEWRADTATVTNFLNAVADDSFSSQSAFHSAAVTAYNAEVDEGTHKAVLDAELPHTPQLEKANTTLVTDGTVQSIVTLLKDLTTLNLHKDTQQIYKDVEEINFGHDGIEGRCQAVLPAVDIYFEQAAKEVQKLDGDTSLFGVQAVVEKACKGSQW